MDLIALPDDELRFISGFLVEPTLTAFACVSHRMHRVVTPVLCRTLCLYRYPYRDDELDWELDPILGIYVSRYAIFDEL